MSESSDIFFSVLRGPKLIGNVVPEYRHVLWSMDKYRQSMDKYRRVQTRTDTDRTLTHKLSKFSSKTTYPGPSNHQINISRKINVRANFFHVRATGIIFTILGGCRHVATSSHKFPRVATSSDKLRQVPTSCDKFRQVATVTEL